MTSCDSASSTSPSLRRKPSISRSPMHRCASTKTRTTGRSAPSTGLSSGASSKVTAPAIASVLPRDAPRTMRASGCVSPRPHMRRSARRLPKPHDGFAVAAVGGVRPAWQWGATRTCRQCARRGCRAGAAERARCVCSPGRREQHLGRAVASHHGIYAGRHGSLFRPRQRQAVSPPAVLQGAARRQVMTTELVEYLLRAGDDRLVLGHRLSEWCGHAPILEEDIALANIALDLVGEASLLLTLAADADQSGRDADALAFLRDGIDYRNILLVELPKGDFAFTIARQ